MKKVNIAELLKDCPAGMELDSTMFEKVTFVRVQMDRQFPIEIAINGIRSKYLTKEGCFHDRTLLPEAKCVIFPKGKTTWEGFHRPAKDGDVVVCEEPKKINQMFIVQSEQKGGRGKCYFGYDFEDDYFFEEDIWEWDRLATEEEKQKLFDAIKEKGYKWNAETKTLEKLIEPSFKVGDKVRHKKNHGVVFTITSIEEDSYVCGAKAAFWFDDQDDYELVPNKFDISTLKPFDKVLVRNKSNEVWTANFYSHYDATSDKPFICVGWSEMNEYRYCIPYEVNNELLGTTNNTEEYGSR